LFVVLPLSHQKVARGHFLTSKGHGINLFEPYKDFPQIP
jgi:hypothetical protein